MKKASSHTKPHVHTLSCGKVYEHLCDNLDSQLDSEECRRIKEHLKDCKNCSALLDSMKKTVTLYKSYPAPKLPGKCRQELFAVIKLSGNKKS
ncbi:MAG: anti-sigma factor family protein [Bacteroidota bacterium]